MERLTVTRQLVIAMVNRMRHVSLNLRHFVSVIDNGTFSTANWEIVNVNDMNEMIRMINRYKMSSLQLPNLIQYYEYLQFNWHHLTDLYLRERLTWIQSNMMFLHQQISYTEEMIRICDEESIRLTSMIENLR